MAIKQEKSKSILLVAKKIFARYGVKKTSVDEIARLARVAKGTIYNYFGSKDQVYLEVLQQEANEVIAKISSAIYQVDSPIDKLKTFVDIKFYSMRQALNMLNLDRNRIEQLLPCTETIHSEYFEKETNIIRSILNEGVEKNIFFIDDTLLAAKAIGYALRGFEIHWLVEESEEHIEHYIEKILHMLFWGIVEKKKS